MMSFFAALVSSTNDVHLYRVFLDGGERTAYVLLNTQERHLAIADSEGRTVDGIRLSENVELEASEEELSAAHPRSRGED